ncbi:MAG TPA: hypothetical protein VLR26_09300 [Frankiaceae bacterium]|nr:hypothetical protein [Frankiaceae bacterium]
MPDTKLVRGFLPSSSGLHFPNSWPKDTPALVVPTPLGHLRFGDASRGLCGGMVLTAADLWTAGRPPPARTEAPPAGSRELNFLTRRLLDSWDLPGGAFRYYECMNLPDADSSSRTGVWRRTAELLPSICAELDADRVCPLGVVTVKSWRPTDLGKNHQVLAYGYSREQDGQDDMVLNVYDPNQPDVDSVIIRCDTTAQRAPEGQLDIPHPVRGVFPIRWSPHDPSGLLADDQESGRPPDG